MTTADFDITSLPLPPKVRISLRARLEAVRNFHTGGELVRDLAGPVAEIPLGSLLPKLVFVSSPRAVQDVLGGTSTAIDKGAIAYAQSRLMGVNLSNTLHAEWKPRRRTLQPLFTKQRVNEYAGYMSKAAGDIAEVWAAGSVIDVDAQMRALTLQVLGHSLYGMELGESAAKIAAAVPRVHTYVIRRATQPVRMPRWFPTPARSRFRRSLGVIQDLVVESLRECESDPDHDSPLIRMLLAARDPETGQSLTRQQIIDELVVFLLAGHDTTSTTLAYALWAVGRDEQLQDQVAAEAAMLGDRPITASDVAALPLATRVLHETMRLCPPAPAVARLPTKDIEVDGYRIPKGTNIFVSIYALHRDPGLWDDPLRFDPERFNPDVAPPPSRWQYIPFAAGPRACIGNHFAMLEATIGLATLVRSVRLRSLHDEFPVAVPFTMTASEPIPVEVRRRE